MGIWIRRGGLDLNIRDGMVESSCLCRMLTALLVGA